jgi:hypothetical protein
MNDGAKAIKTYISKVACCGTDAPWWNRCALDLGLSEFGMGAVKFSLVILAPVEFGRNSDGVVKLQRSSSCLREFQKSRIDRDQYRLML